MAGGRHLAGDSGHTVGEGSRASRATPEAECLHHRQPKCEKCGKRGADLDPSGFAAGKRVNGKKRQVLVDPLGLLFHALVPPAHVQDRDGGLMLLSALADRFPRLAKLVAAGVYPGPRFHNALVKVRPQLQPEIGKRSDPAPGFVVLPKRWSVERTIAWLKRCRRLAKDFENRTRNASAFVQLASIRLMLRKLCNPF